MPFNPKYGVLAGARYRWYVGSQAVSIAGTMMTNTALYWLALHIARGNAVQLAVVAAAQFLPMLFFSRRAGAIVTRHRSARVVITTQSALAAESLALGVPLLAGWMPLWYLWALSFAVGCVQTVDVPGRQTFMRDLVGDANLRQGSSLYAGITGISKIIGPALAGFIIAAAGEATVFVIDSASFLLVIAVLTWISRGIQREHSPEPGKSGSARRSAGCSTCPGACR